MHERATACSGAASRCSCVLECVVRIESVFATIVAEITGGECMH